MSVPYDYDFIVAGAGAAGRSFVYQLLNTGLKDSRVLVIDRQIDKDEDRTWCFWESDQGPFEEIVHHRWNKLWFHGPQYSELLNIAPFTYKMIRSLDYYEYTKQAMNAVSTVDLLLPVQHISFKQIYSTHSIHSLL